MVPSLSQSTFPSVLCHAFWLDQFLTPALEDIRYQGTYIRGTKIHTKVGQQSLDTRLAHRSPRRTCVPSLENYCLRIVFFKLFTMAQFEAT